MLLLRLLVVAAVMLCHWSEQGDLMLDILRSNTSHASVKRFEATTSSARTQRTGAVCKLNEGRNASSCSMSVPYHLCGLKHSNTSRGLRPSPRVTQLRHRRSRAVVAWSDRRMLDSEVDSTLKGHECSSRWVFIQRIRPKGLGSFPTKIEW